MFGLYAHFLVFENYCINNALMEILDVVVTPKVPLSL